MSSNITAHMIVKNEDKWIWYSIMSVIDYVDKMIIFDTGSNDNTIEIINEVISDSRYRDKIEFEKKDTVTKETFYKLRQEQIDMTKTKYFMVVDGDEIWYKKSMDELVKLTKTCKYDLIATKFINVAGDIFHYRDFNRETYTINGITGSLTIRVYSMNIDGIKCAGEYGVEGYYDSLNKPVQESKWNIYIMENEYLHTSLLKRSSNLTGDMEIKYRRSKIFAEYDYKFDKYFKYPEVLYIDRPSIVDSAFNTKIDIFRGILNILRKIKRKIK